LIPKGEKWKYVNFNPTPPKVRGLFKFHTMDAPIRPIINWQNAPASKLARFVIKCLGFYFPLPSTFYTPSLYILHPPPPYIRCYKYSSINSDIQEISSDEDLKLVLFDISNMYTNIPTSECF
jgi:hypothetical protein